MPETGMSRQEQVERRASEDYELILVRGGIAILSYSFESIADCNNFLLAIKRDHPSFAGKVRVGMELEAPES